MLNFSKSALIVAIAIIMAIASYAIAWWNIEKIKDEKVILHTESQVQKMDPVQILLQEVEQTSEPSNTILFDALSQSDVSQSIAALKVVAFPEFETLARWQKNSRKGIMNDGKYYVAIIIDDIGVVTERSNRAINELPKEITLAFLPYGEATQSLSQKAYDKGHEIMIHLPMQAKEGVGGYKADPGKDALYTSTVLNQIQPLVEKNFAFLKESSVGVNNHMGSQFTEWEEGLKEVFKIVEREQLFFLDSLTTPDSKVEKSIEDFNIPFLKRDVFLDHVIAEDKIMQALEKVEAIAKSKGSAIAIGHPHDETMNSLIRWIKTLDDKNIQLVPITALIKE